MMTPSTRRRRSATWLLAAFVLSAAAYAAAPSTATRASGEAAGSEAGAEAEQDAAPGKPAAIERPLTPAARLALLQRLEAEKGRLSRLQAELEQVRNGTPRAPFPAATPAAAKEPKASVAAGQAEPALAGRPSLGAADVLYRLGRYREARAVYEATAALPKVTKDDRIWALLQAGNCCRRLGEFDAALEHFQTITADYPDNPWSKGHVAWALKAAQWEKRWHRIELQTGE